MYLGVHRGTRAASLSIFVLFSIRFIVVGSPPPTRHTIREAPVEHIAEINLSLRLFGDKVAFCERGR